MINKLLIDTALKFSPSLKTLGAVVLGAVLFAFGYYMIYNHGYNAGFNKASTELNNQIITLKENQNKQLQETIKELDRQQRINIAIAKQKREQEQEHKKQKQDLIEDINKLKGKQENEEWLSTPVPSDVLEFLRNKKQ